MNQGVLRRFRGLATIAATFAILAGPTGANAVGLDPKFCRSPQTIVGFGVPSHFPLHYNIYIPSYEESCPKAIGLVSYYSGSDSAILARAINRGPDPASYEVFDSFWGKDVAFTALEKVLIEANMNVNAQSGSVQQNQFRVSELGHFPIFIDGLAVAYNVPCYKQPLRLSTLNLALMYQGTITTWDDPRLVTQNPGIEKSCTGKVIKLTARADTTGSTLVFKSLLAKRDPAWLAYGQPQLNTTWPTTMVCRGGGDRGAAGCIAANSGSIGYVSMARAQKSRLKVAKIERLTFSASSPAVPAVDYVAPSISGCKAAASALVLPPGFDSYTDWSQISLVDSNAGYPLCYFNFITAFRDYVRAYGSSMPIDKAETTRDYIATIIGAKVQQRMEASGYASIPANILTIDQAGLAAMGNCSIPSNGPLNDLHNGAECNLVPHTSG